MDNSHVIVSESQTIKQQVFTILDRNPLEKPKVICILLGLDYRQHGGTVANCKTEWKSHFNFGLRPSCPTSQHHVRAWWVVPKDFNRVLALGMGWNESKNRNKTLCWNKNKNDFGRIELFTSGKILASVKKPHTLTRARQLFMKALWDTYLITDPKVIGAFLDNVRWKGADDVYETTERLPYKVIDNYVESHGIRILLGDASHPNAVEVQWCYPDWAERAELREEHCNKILEYNSRVLEQNNKVIENDSKVIETDSRAIQQFSQLMQDLSAPKARSRDDRSVVV